jgi:hypothetical protein
VFITSRRSMATVTATEVAMVAETAGVMAAATNSDRSRLASR